MANWWDKNLTDKQKFRLQEPQDQSLLDVVSTVPNPVGDVASGLLAAQDVSKGNYGTAALNALGLLPFVPSMGGVVKNVGKEVNAYPLAPAGTRYEEYSGNLTYMTPDEYLRNVRPLTLDESSLDNIADLKRHVESGGKLDPLAIYPNGKEDGRHRAYLAKELGINQVPVALHGRTKYEIQQATAQKNATLPVSKGGLGLPVNNTAMDRAKALGFDINNPAYHGTTKDISEFDVNAARGKGFNTGSNVTDNPYLANTYTMGINSGNVMPLYIKDNPAMVVEAGGKNWNRLGQSTKVKAPAISVVDKETNDLLTQLGVESNNNPVVKKGFSKTLKKMFPDEFLFDDYFSTDDLARFARNQGYGSAKFNDIVDIGSSGMMFTEKAGLPSNNQVIFDPSLIRSRFAAFDPFRRNEADILAGVAPLAVGSLLGLNTYNNMQEKPKKEKKKTK